MEALFKAYSDFIPDFDLFQEALRSPLPTHLRINRLKGEPAEIVRSLEKSRVCLDRSLAGSETLYVARGLDSPGKLPLYFLGQIHPQALTSCLASLALSPTPGSYVLDMCAAPGGKTTHMADIMENRGLIVANELYPTRHVSLGHTLDRLGALNTVITGYQAQQFPLHQRFDFILADVPCSGEGRFRKTNGKAAYKKDQGRNKLARLQKSILLRGFDLLKKGGIMLYTTCTYNPEENESVVQALLEERDAVLLPVELECPHEPGIPGWREKTYDRRIRKAARFYPHHIDSVGFFMAGIGKRA